MPDTVALVGFGPKTMHYAADSQAEEMWTISVGYRLEVPRIDRLFEIHPLWFIRDKNYPNKPGWPTHYNWLRRKHDFPIYMQRDYKTVPASVRYPFEAITESIFAPDMDPYYTSSFGYMLAYAIWLGVKRMELYGFDLDTDTEWRYQLAGAEFMIGVAMGRGIEVVIPKETSLLKGRLYGYEAMHMVTRQRLEHYKQTYQGAMNVKMAEVNGLQERWNIVSKNGDYTDEEKEAVQLQLQSAFSMMNKFDGALQLIQQMIDECDMKEGKEYMVERIKTTEI